MTIDWPSLALVAFTTVVGTVVVVGILAAGVLALSAPTAAGRSTRPWWRNVVGWGCGAAAGLLVLFGLYLIVPAFH